MEIILLTSTSRGVLRMAAEAVTRSKAMRRPRHNVQVGHSVAVSGAAHYDLSHSSVVNAVSTVLLVWDGAANVADFDGSLARALGSPETRRTPAATDPVIPQLALDSADG